jgi:CRISPR-associated protein Cas1
VLKGRLGLETARIPHVDRHGLIGLGRGRLWVEDGTLRFTTAGAAGLEAGDYAIPFQNVSCVLLEPGSMVSHDALRLLARHGTGLLAVGEGGVRLYASMPFGPDNTVIARAQARSWADPEVRTRVARRMYGWRMGEVFPDAQIAVLRGMEGARMKETYRRVAERFGIPWKGRRYDRANPEAADAPNQAFNHAASAVEAAAMVAVSATGAIPQLGFIHEDSGNAFTLDVADMFRDSVTLPLAFAAARQHDPKSGTLERKVRKLGGKLFVEKQVVSSMIDKIKELFGADDGRGHS